MVEMGQRLIRRENEERIGGVKEILEAEDVAMHLGAQCIRF
jgi:hypothetical protein